MLCLCIPRVCANFQQSTRLVRPVLMPHRAHKHVFQAIFRLHGQCKDWFCFVYAFQRCVQIFNRALHLRIFYFPHHQTGTTSAVDPQGAHSVCLWVFEAYGIFGVIRGHFGDSWVIFWYVGYLGTRKSTGVSVQVGQYLIKQLKLENGHSLYRQWQGILIIRRLGWRWVCFSRAI